MLIRFRGRALKIDPNKVYIAKQYLPFRLLQIRLQLHFLYRGISQTGVQGGKQLPHSTPQQPPNTADILLKKLCAPPKKKHDTALLKQ